MALCGFYKGEEKIVNNKFTNTKFIDWFADGRAHCLATPLVGRPLCDHCLGDCYCGHCHCCQIAPTNPRLNYAKGWCFHCHWRSRGSTCLCTCRSFFTASHTAFPYHCDCRARAHLYPGPGSVLFPGRCSFGYCSTAYARCYLSHLCRYAYHHDTGQVISSIPGT